MFLTAHTAAYGPEATAMLGALLAERRGDDPLAPATVLVPRSWVGLATRRRLVLDSATGLANVAFTTLARLADDVAGRELAGIGTPRTDAELAAAVRAAVADEPGVFAAVASHPATVQALTDAWRALRDASPASLDRIAAIGPRQRDVIRLARSVSARLGTRYDERDLLDAATRRARVDPHLADRLGPVIVHLPDHLAAHHVAFLRALAERSEVHAVLGTTGDPTADATTLELARRLDPAAVVPPAAAPSLGTAVVSAPGADTEVRWVLRDIAARVAAGSPYERIAIVYASAAPYARLVADACNVAEVPVVAPSARRLAQTVPGRALLGALALPAADWPRHDVVAWLDSVPVTWRGRPVPVRRWDDVSMRAGITHGLARWRRSLGAVEVRSADTAAALGTDPDDDRAARRRVRGADAASLRAFIDELADRLEPSPAPSTWAAWAHWAADLLHWALGANPEVLDHPTEAEAMAHIERALHALARLDDLDPSPDRAAFLAALRAELDAPAPQTARFGSGVLVGPYRDVIGLDLDVLYVVGAVDGVLPTRPRDDAVLSEADRSTADGDVPLLADRAAEQRRTWCSALASAPERILTTARGDQRTGREQRPARWWLDALGALAGAVRPLYAGDLDYLDPIVGHVVLPSLVACVAADGAAAGAADARQRMLLRAARRGDDLRHHWLATAQPALGAGFDVRHGRRVGAFSRFEGNIDVAELPSPVTGDVLSATRLEAYAACPRRYLFRSVLDVRPLERPEDLIEADRRTVGTIVHKVLELFLDEELARPEAERQPPSVPWATTDHTRLDELADEVFDDFAAKGLTGHPLLWQLTSSGIRRDLHALLVADDHHRARTGARVAAVELFFGDDTATAVAVPLGDGRTVHFRGSIDRVDRTETGIAVLDYKHAAPERYKPITTDPVRRGQLLQLPLYALAAEAAMPSTTTTTTTTTTDVAYWFTTQQGRFAQLGYRLGDEQRERLYDVVDHLVTGIEAGQFPARPIDALDHKHSPCTWCDHRPACPNDRDLTWSHLRETPALADLVATLDHDWPSTPDDAGVASAVGRA